MSFPQFFIDRPIFASVISILIVLVGAIAYLGLPVTQYPEVAPPTIQVSAVFPGASAQTVAETVATPIEQEVNGVEGMLYMTSQSTNDGRMSLTITFAIGTDLDEAQVLVQNRVAVAEPRLPEEVRAFGVTTRKNSPDLMMVVHLRSPNSTYDQLYISNYALLQVRDVLARINGVGSILIFGARDYSMRVWLDPDRLASLNLTASDVVAALRSQNTQVASGVLGQPPQGDPSAFEVNIQTLGRLSEAEQFEQIIVKTGENGRLTRLGDVARVELGAQDYQTNSYLDNESAVAIAIFQQPGTNALRTADAVSDSIEELSKDFPEGLEYQIVYNPTEYIAESVNEVYKTIFEASLLVVLVVFAFLQSLRGALIPIIAIPVSLVGTFAVMAAFGFSLNNLTLFGLVLAIGIVVDDAIVVVENVERNIERGLSPKEATRKSMREVGGVLVAVALVLSSVFIPTAFLTGISGQFYRQFALTIAAATIISAFVSLTLSPALCAMLLRPHDDRIVGKSFLGPFFRWFNKGFEETSNRYQALVRRSLRMLGIMALIYAGMLALTWFQFARTPTGFIPAQDQGYFITVVQLPPGASLARTDAVVQKAIGIIRETPGVAHAVAFAGFNGATFTNASNGAAIFVPLKPYEERAHEGLATPEILANLRGRLMGIQSANVFVVEPPPVRGIGTGGGFKMMIQDRGGRGLDTLMQATYGMMGRANQEPGLVQVFSPFETSTPQIYADIDRAKAEMLDVPVDNIFSTLSVYLGSAYVNDFNFLGRSYRVTAQADEEFRRSAEDIENLRTRNATGDMVPLGSVATFRDIIGPSRVPHYNLYPASDLSGSTLPGVSSGDAIKKMERIAAEVLPPGIDYEWTDLAYQEKTQGNTSGLVFTLAVIFVFLVLAAQYESWMLPLAVILIVPMCLLAAMLGVGLRGMDNNILTQIGLIVLVGLAAKNAILIVEFAKQKEDEGQSRLEAAAAAAGLRLRPIVMTSFAFILGVLPLVIATGAGSEMRQALGTTVFFGMIGVLIFGLIFTPAFYAMCRIPAERRAQRLAASAAPAE